ncbi:MAG: T9SS type A sorting domain-containing protein [bacterium]
MKQSLKQVQGRVQGDTNEEVIERKGIGRIIQALVVDGIGLDTAFITPNHLKRISIWLPKSVYGDGEVIIEIKKIKGKRVVCSEIGLYEFPGATKSKDYSGPMGDEGLINAGRFLFERIYPNPAKGSIKVRFNTPNFQPIILKLYDVAGRLVQKVDFIPNRIGDNEITFGLNGLPSGIYFVRLETENYNKFEKVIIVR